MSQAYRIHDIDETHSLTSPNFLNNLSLTPTPIPTPGHGSVLIRIRAVSLNYRDLLIVAHSPHYPTQARSELVPCCDGAGEIVGVGPGSKWKDSIGDAVIVTPTRSWIDGDVESYAFESTLGGGDEMVASAMGAKVIATSSADNKLEIAKKLGASELVNYKSTPEWGDEVLRVTNGRGVDLVADVGGSGTVEESIKSLRQGGTACLIGFLAPPKLVDLVFPLLIKGKILKGIIAFSRKMLQQVVDLVEKHDLHPLIMVYEWEDAKEAFEQMKGQNFVGKIVI